MSSPPATCADLTAAFAAGSDDPCAALERCLDQIARRDGQIRAFVVVDAPGARKAAAASAIRWREGRQLGPVDGVPLAIKDIFETAGMPTGHGSTAFAGWQPHHDAACVWALRQAGAVILGKTVTTEFAARVPGPTHNPHDLARSPGGSSSGSAAAVAAGMVPAAVGSQVLGSVVRPASFCGVVGYKPSYGALNKGGCLDSYSQNCPGVLAHSVADAWAVADAIARHAGGDPGWPPLAGGPMPPARAPARLALIETAGWTKASAGARAELDTALERLKASGVAILDRHSSALVAAVEAVIADTMELAADILAFEFRWPLGPILAVADGEVSTYQHEVMAQARALSGADYTARLLRREAMRATWAALAAECDAGITLAATGAAPQGLDWTGDPIFAAPGSTLGIPTISLPLLQDQDLPLGLQLMGFHGRDRDLVAQAAWCMGSLDARGAGG